MAFGISLAAAAAGLSAAGTAFTMYTGWQQAKYQSAVAKNNAALAERNAELSVEASQREQQRSDLEYAATIGEQLGMQSASGLDVLGRSQLAVRNQTRRVRGTAAEDIRRQGEQQAAGFNQDAVNFKSEAAAANSKAIGSLIGGALELGGKAASGDFKALGIGKKKMPWSNGGNAAWYGRG